MTAFAFYLFGVVTGIAFLAVCNAWDRAGKKLDALVAEQPTTRPTSSARKAGRTGVRG